MKKKEIFLWIVDIGFFILLLLGVINFLKVYVTAEIGLNSNITIGIYPLSRDTLMYLTYVKGREILAFIDSIFIALALDFSFIEKILKKIKLFKYRKFFFYFIIGLIVVQTMILNFFCITHRLI